MGRITRPLAENGREEERCTYRLTSDKDPEAAGRCAAPCRPGSSYCLRHHALCHLPRGSRAEKVRLREVKTLADMVGGRRSRDGEGPSRRFLDRLEQAVREFL
jgi:hypothetical protein